MISSAGRNAPIQKRFAVVSLALMAPLAMRFVAEVVWLLPSPVGDGGFFITASANYCRSGFLGTTAYAIDPTGQSRMIWHGFVSTMLFGAANVSCSARGYYFLLWLLKAATLAAVVNLAKRRGYSTIATFGLGLFVLTAQTASGFRPETMSILLVILAETALAAGWYWTLGVLAGTMLCTQPTVAGIYALTMLLLRPALLKFWLPIGVGALLTAAILLALYPFPVADLLTGIRLQAVRLVGRSDGNIAGYYLLNAAMPAWGLLLVAAIAAIARRVPRFLLILPVLWFFGPRVPPVFYNLVPLTVMLIAIVLTPRPSATANWLAFLGIAVGVFGLGTVSTRDLMTAYRYGDTFAATRASVHSLATQDNVFDSVPPMLALTNPELRLTDPTARSNHNAPAREGMDLFAVNGMPRSPCPNVSPEAPVSLLLGQRILFNSNSGWMIYVCRPSSSLGDQSEIMPAARRPLLGANPSERRSG
jgi:hypothetical protein